MLLDAHVKSSLVGVKTKTKGDPKAGPNATEAALLAYALLNGRLNTQQACRLAGASTAYLSLVTRMSADERERLGRGEFTLGQVANAKRNNGNGNAQGHAETLTQHLKRSSRDEFIAAVREFGISLLFDTAFVPILEQDRVQGSVVVVQESAVTQDSDS
jgi:hypothetical protein